MRKTNVREEIRKNSNKIKSIIKGISIILIIGVIICIYKVSPLITNLIKTVAYYLYELEDVQITRVVELILAISFIVTISIPVNKVIDKESK